MATRKTNPSVDFFFVKAKQWRDEFEKLRSIALDCGLTEVLKWGQPCYTYNNANIVLIHGFKEYCALLFFKGALLQDAENLLVQQTENVQSARQLRFTSVKEVMQKRNTIKTYIQEAVAVEQAGLKVVMKKPAEFAVAEEFQARLYAMPRLATAFAALTPGRQRAYLLFFSQPKQSKTRVSRVEKSIEAILAGRGRND